MEMMTREDFNRLKEAQTEAEHDDTPYLAVVDDEMHVVGNPNQTERKKHTYTVTFAYPNLPQYKEQIKEKIKKETDNLIVFDRTFKNVFVPPRRHTAVVNEFVKLQMWYNAVTDDGETRPYTEEELAMMLDSLSDELLDSVYDVVGVVLGLSEQERDYMMPSSVLDTMVQIYKDNPELANESDLFFG